ncbi:DMT family transporter [Dermabacter hominis]|uniref:DMT family transporter n=1 Tax=Dermabacter hominis TaxID=36740 RepID=UPI0021A51241|nr:DMT family transporter [Dermabacter hominis]MCT1788966.1 DMT family transporter [Dermabacter hominis]
MSAKNPATKGNRAHGAAPRAPWWAIAIIMAGGVLAALQSRINADLAGQLESPSLAAFVSFGIGCLGLCVIVLSLPAERRAARDYARDIATGRFDWRYAIGGLGGAFLVFTQSLTVGVLGVALFIVSVVAGQTIAGAALDRVGFGPGEPRRLSTSRLVGSALMVASVALALASALTNAVPWLHLILPFVAGIGVGLQTGANGIITAHTGSFLVSALGNFTLGSLALGIAAAVSLALTPLGGAFPTNPVLYLGGLIGLTYIAASAALVRYTGVLVLSGAAIAGQIIGSVMLDALDPSVHLSPLTVIGAALTLLAAVIIAGYIPLRSPRPK